MASRYAAIAAKIEFTLLGTSFIVHTGEEYLQVRWKAPDCKTGIMKEQHGRKWRVSEHMTNSEVVQTIFMAIMAAMEHEIREDFKYRGEAIFGPHYDVEALVGLCKANGLEYRRG